MFHQQQKTKLKNKHKKNKKNKEKVVYDMYGNLVTALPGNHYGGYGSEALAQAAENKKRLEQRHADQMRVVNVSSFERRETERQREKQRLRELETLRRSIASKLTLGEDEEEEEEGKEDISNSLTTPAPFGSALLSKVDNNVNPIPPPKSIMDELQEQM